MPARKSKLDQRARLDNLDEMKDWGMGATCCAYCGLSNSEIDGALIQCAKCKKAHYCSVKCFNADLQNHVQYCKTGVMQKGPTVYQGYLPDCKPCSSYDDSTKATEPSDSTILTTESSDDDASSVQSAASSESDASSCSSSESSAQDHDDSEGSISLEGADEDDSFELDMTAMATNQVSQENMLVLEVQEIEEEEEEVHPLYLFLDAEEVQEADTVIWLLRSKERDFSVIRTDQDEEIEIIRSAQGTATILEDVAEDCCLSDDDHDHSLKLPEVERPTQEEFQQEAVHLYGTDTSDNVPRIYNRSPSWAQHRCSLRSVSSHQHQPRRQSFAEPPTWVSSRSLKRAAMPRPATQPKGERSVPDWIVNRPFRSASELWGAAEQDGESRVRLYRRVMPGDTNKEGKLGDIPADVKDTSVLFCRLPLKPVGTRPRGVEDEDITESFGAYDEEDISESASSLYDRRRQSARNLAYDERAGSDSSVWSIGSAENLRPVPQQARKRSSSSSRPSWATGNASLRKTGRRQSLLSGNSQRRLSTVNVHVPWKNQQRKKNGRSASVLSFSSNAAT